MKQSTCFKNSEKPSCIDLILTKKPKSFQSACVIETRLSDFQRMIVFVLKMHFRKLPPRVINYSDFSNYRPFAHSFTLRGHKLFKKGQLQGRLKQLSLEQDQITYYKIKVFLP